MSQDIRWKQRFSNFKKATIQTAFQTQLITEGDIWIDALEKRNLMAHTYPRSFTLFI